jgi:hypothetical protein
VSDTGEKEDGARTSRWSDEPRKEQEMITTEELIQRDQAEEDLIAWLEAKSTQELRQFLAGSWMASLLSPENIEELYEEQEMIAAQERAPRGSAEEDVKAWTQATSTLELSQFLASPWVASLLSDEAIEELSQELEQREAVPLEVGLD